MAKHQVSRLEPSLTWPHVNLDLVEGIECNRARLSGLQTALHHDASIGYQVPHTDRRSNPAEVENECIRNRQQRKQTAEAAEVDVGPANGEEATEKLTGRVRGNRW